MKLDNTDLTVFMFKDHFNNSTFHNASLTFFVADFAN